MLETETDGQEQDVQALRDRLPSYDESIPDVPFFEAVRILRVLHRYHDTNGVLKHLAGSEKDHRKSIWPSGVELSALEKVFNGQGTRSVLHGRLETLISRLEKRRSSGNYRNAF